MKTTEHLDRIFKLGFLITLNWNEDLEIYYSTVSDYTIGSTTTSQVVPSSEFTASVLRCSYYKSDTNPHSYEEMIEVCCDIFYSWYNKNLQLLKKFDEQDQDFVFEFEDICLGDITKVVFRDMNLTDLFSNPEE